MKIPSLKSLTALVLLATRVAPLSQFVTSMDRKILRRRAAAEGIPFLCKTLPLLAAALERGLADGVFSAPVGFKTHKNGPLCAFLYEALSVIFDPVSGIRVDVCDDAYLKQSKAVLTIRQICLMAGKCESIGVDPVLARVAWNSFKTNQARIAAIDLTEKLDEMVVGTHTKLKAVLLSARKRVTQVCSSFCASDLRPRHGSGACPDGTEPYMRYDVANATWNDALNAVFPYDEYLFASPSHLARDWTVLSSIPKVDRFYDQALFVPKKYEQLRGISLVPPTPMYFQLGLARWFKQRYRSPHLRHELDLTDQQRNRDLARKASIDGNNVTLDLKAASDSLKWRLVAWLLADVPTMRDALFATRSVGTKYQSDTQDYECYAPMGNGTCFPVQTLVFWALAKAATAVALGRDSRVSVYGDDIICPRKASAAVVQVLEMVGLQVNQDKSFVTGFFRESCGGDYFRGHDVSPVRVRSFPTGELAPQGDMVRAVSLVDYANRLRNRFHIHECEHVHQIHRKLAKVWYGLNIPILPESAFQRAGAYGQLASNPTYEQRQAQASQPAVIAFVGDDTFDCARGFKRRFNSQLHRREVELLTFRSLEYDIVPRDLSRNDWKKFPSSMRSRGYVRTRTGWSSTLQKFLLQGADEGSRLVHTPRGRVALRTVWVAY